MGKYRQPYSLHKRGKYWYYQTYDNNGVRTSAKTTGCTSKNAAKDYCEQLKLTGQLLSINMTFHEYALNFYAPDSPFCADRITPLAEITRRSWESKLNNVIMPYFRNIKVSNITYTIVKAFRMNLIDNGKNYSTIRQTMQSLSFILRAMYRDGLIARNPMDVLEPLRNTDCQNRDSLTLDEICTVIAHAPLDLQDLLILMALTGMRISEAYGIRQNDIINNEYIHLTKQLDSKEYKPLKTKDSRDLIIIPELIPLCHDLGYAKAYIYEQVNPLLRNCKSWKERKLSIHSIRHFFITDTKTKNINPLLVEAYAGHSLKGIQNVYTNFHAEDFKPILEWQEKTLKEIKRACSEVIPQAHGTKVAVKLYSDMKEE